MVNEPSAKWARKDTLEPLIDAKELAKHLSVRKEYIYKLAKDQKMPHYRIGERQYMRFSLRDVMSWLDYSQSMFLSDSLRPATKADAQEWEDRYHTLKVEMGVTEQRLDNLVIRLAGFCVASEKLLSAIEAGTSEDIQKAAITLRKVLEEVESH